METPSLSLPENSRVYRVAPWVAEEPCQRAIAAFALRLGEPETRWLAGLLAMIVGHGGINAAADLVGLSTDTVSRGKAELAADLEGCPWGRKRAEGAGRPPVEAVQPGIEGALSELVEPHLYGDPESGRTYCRRSTRYLAKRLADRGFPVSAETVRRLLKKGGIQSGQTSSASLARHTPTATSSSR